MTKLEETITRYKANGGKYFKTIKEYSPNFKIYEPLYPYDCFVAKNASYQDKKPSNKYTVLQFHNDYKNIIQIGGAGQYKTLAEARAAAKRVDHVITKEEVAEREELGKKKLIEMMEKFNELVEMYKKEKGI